MRPGAGGCPRPEGGFKRDDRDRQLELRLVDDSDALAGGGDARRIEQHEEDEHLAADLTVGERGGRLLAEVFARPHRLPAAPVGVETVALQIMAATFALAVPWKTMRMSLHGTCAHAATKRSYSRPPGCDAGLAHVSETGTPCAPSSAGRS